MSATKPVSDTVQICKSNAAKLRSMAQMEANHDVKKLLLEAAHHLDVSVAEVDYIVADATVSI